MLPATDGGWASDELYPSEVDEPTCAVPGSDRGASGAFRTVTRPPGAAATCHPLRRLRTLGARCPALVSPLPTLCRGAGPPWTPLHTLWVDFAPSAGGAKSA